MTMVAAQSSFAGVEMAATESIAFVLAEPVDVTPSGHEATISWRGVAGATGVRIDRARVTVHPTTSGVGRRLGVAAAGHSDVTDIDVVSPAPGTLVRSITISDLQVHEEGRDEPRRVDTEGLGSFRLVLAPNVNGAVQAPTIAVPALASRNALPAQLTGGSLAGSVLSLPDVTGDRFRVTVVTGDAPEDFVPERITHGDVVVHAAPGPVGLHVVGPDGSELYARGGPLTVGETVDVSAALQRHLGAAATELGGPGDALTAAISVRSDQRGQASVNLDVSGVIERKIGERLSVECTGGPVTIDVPAPHPGRAARHTVADITVTHHGAALHPLSSQLPIADAALGGPVVRDVAVVRRLPPQALAGEQLARVGVVGWPLAGCDLSLSVLGQTAAVTDAAAPAGRRDPSVVWFVFPDPILVNAPVELALTATRGAFGWIADPDPLVRLAVAAQPAGRGVTVGGNTVSLTGAETTVAGAILDGSGSWGVVTDQFCTVSVANAVMEFAP
ncbi:MAG: hypothetical protein ACRD0G_18090 [Acidimicrobiales bacterium]